MLSEKEKIKHLYNRAAFGMTVNDWKTKTNFQQEVDKLFQQKSYQSIQAVTLEEVQEAKDKMKTLAKEDVKDLKQLMKANVFELNNLWLNEMVHSEAQLQEKMALFWHGRLARTSFGQ